MIKKRIKYSIVTAFCFLLFRPNGVTAQDGFVIRQQGFIRISPLYQTWSDDGGNTLSETSMPIYVYKPLGRNTSMGLLGGGATVGSEFSSELGGLIDTQIDFNYYIESSKIVLHSSVNLPTGKRKLSLEEFETSYLISLNMYNFQIPGFGQGLNISPGLSWAKPMSENVVLGLGASFQYRGAFQPFADMTGLYDPGDEILLTGGLDFRLNETSTFSADVIFTSYGKDKLDGDVSFQSGNKIVINAQFRLYHNHNELWLFGRYRSKDKNKIAIAGGMHEEDEKTIPDQVEFMGRYRMLMQKRIYVSVVADGRFFNETKVFNVVNIFGLGLTVEFPVSNGMSVPIRLKYFTGKIENGPTLSGLEFGVGLDWSF
ncbi:MAG: hypothetical protein ABIL68_10425 [bacterium]